MPTAEINGTEIYYEIHGSGFPLVFVHGGYGGLGTGAVPSNPDWLDKFTDDFQVILADRRSSGRSGFPEEPHTMEQFSADIVGLLDQLGHDRAHVWGTSAGGPITIQFGLSHPEMTTSLVVTDTAPWLTEDDDIKARLKERIGILEAEGGDAAYAVRREGGTVGLQLFSASRPAADEAEKQQREERAAAIRAPLGAIPCEVRIAKYAGELRTYRAYVDWDATETFGSLAKPVLVLYGTGDTVFPDVDWASLAEGHDNITYREYPGAEHGITGVHPEALTEIRQFVRDASPTTAG